jgi:hypothetical protein
MKRFRILMRIWDAYYHHPSLRLLARDVIRGAWRGAPDPDPDPRGSGSRYA